MGNPEGAERRWWQVDREGARLRWKVVALLPKASLRLTVAVAGLLVLQIAVPLAFMLNVGRAVSLVGPAVAGGPGSRPADQLMLALGVVGILFVIEQASGPILATLGDQLGLQFRSLVFHRTLLAMLRPATVAHLEDPATRDLVVRASEPGQYGPRSAVIGMVNQWSTRLAGGAGLILVFRYEWVAGVALFAAIVHAVRRTRLEHLEIVRAQFRQTQVLRRSDYLRDLLATPTAAKEVRIFGLSDWVLAHFREEWGRAMAPAWERRRLIQPWITAIVPMVAVVGAVAVLAVRDEQAGVIGLGSLVVVLQAATNAVSASAVSIYDAWVEMGVASVGAMVALEEAVETPRMQLPGRRDPDGLPRSTIRCEDVRFAYPGQDRSVFEGLDLEIEAGTSLAVVGANGAGKTTFVKLLTRLYDPTGGRITVDGVDLREFDARAWQRRNAVVFQDFVRYPWSAADNVTLGRPVDGDVLAAVAEQAGVLELVERLPDGWDTVLTRQFGGVDLSGGEWQRVALARALYASRLGAPILVLDEPTAHLDVRQEAAFYDRFLELTQGKTAIVISHRFSTVRRAQQIVVLEQGRVLEQGGHDELMHVGGRYASMFELQASRFADEEPAGA